MRPVPEVPCRKKWVSEIPNRKNPGMSDWKGIPPIHSYSFRMGLEPEKSSSTWMSQEVSKWLIRGL